MMSVWLYYLRNRRSGFFTRNFYTLFLSPKEIIIMFWNRILLLFICFFFLILDSCNNSIPVSDSKKSDFEKGKEVYGRTCIACHLADGRGIATTFPPLAQSDFLTNGKTAVIVQVIQGKTG